MKRIFRLLLSFFVLIVFSLEKPSYSVTLDYRAAFKKAMSKKLKFKNFGLALYEKTPAGVYAPVLLQNADQFFIPASISKVLTAMGLFESYPINKSISTQILSYSKPSSATFDKDIYIKGHGDPVLVSEKMWLLVNELRKWGVKNLKGNLIFDDFAFDQKTLAGDRSKWNQRAYNAPLTALALNWNAVRVRLLSPSPAKAVVDPFNPYFLLKLSSKKKRSSQVEVQTLSKGELLKVQYGKDAAKEEKSIYRRVNSPRKVFESQFLQNLKEAGIMQRGAVFWKPTPKVGLMELGRIESPPLNEMITLMMKHSNNFMAGMLTKHLAFDQFQKTAAYNQGVDLLKTKLMQIEKLSVGFRFESASGLSRDNAFSPSLFLKFLLKAQNKIYYPEFLSSFPLSCVDGTLSKRLCSKKGLVRAKTGLLAGVSALAGYAKSTVGKDYAFVFIYNGKNGNQFEARNSFDRFLENIL